ncbi:MAG: HlyD family efflux transporter periplasmic adaptor subunit [Chitinispirillaceae bacterium]|nr:HlyD family efflux transporter periplasmic adaptor subunit [Chitinispirillaceae bacterium]
MKKFNKNKFFFELVLAMVTLFMFLSMVAFIIIIMILPINNYHHADGYVEFKRQYTLVSQVEGVIEVIYKENNSTIDKKEPLFRYSSEKNEQEIAALEFRESFLANELKTMARLFELGVIQSTEIDKKNLEMNELRVRKEYLQRNVIAAPTAGKVYYKILPKYLKGSFINKGQELAIIYTEENKHIKVSFPNAYADRFKIGSDVFIKYKDPRTFKIQKMQGTVYMSFLNQKTNMIDLFIEVTRGREFLELFNPSTIVSTAIVINNTSIYEELFGIPVSPSIQNLILKNRWYENIKRYL